MVAEHERFPNRDGGMPALALGASTMCKRVKGARRNPNQRLPARWPARRRNVKRSSEMSGTRRALIGWVACMVFGAGCSSCSLLAERPPPSDPAQRTARTAKHCSDVNYPLADTLSTAASKNSTIPNWRHDERSYRCPRCHAGRFASACWRRRTLRARTKRVTRCATQRSFIPKPARICGMQRSIRAVRVADCLADVKCMT